MRISIRLAVLGLVALGIAACGGLPAGTGKIDGYGGVFGERYGTIGGGV